MIQFQDENACTLCILTNNIHFRKFIGGRRCKVEGSSRAPNTSRPALRRRKEMNEQPMCATVVFESGFFYFSDTNLVFRCMF
jgi:hypothetical protein